MCHHITKSLPFFFFFSLLLLCLEVRLNEQCRHTKQVTTLFFVFFSGSQFTDGGAPCVQPMTENGERQVREWLLMFFDKNSMGYSRIGGWMEVCCWWVERRWNNEKNSKY
jgi:hypothetical protein